MGRHAVRRHSFGVALVAVALIAPAALATNGKPVAGGFYRYGDSPNPKTSVAWVRVSPDGRSVQVGWGLGFGSGCVGRAYGGKVQQVPAGDVVKSVPVTATGTFHGVNSRKVDVHTRYHRGEVYGVFAPDGSYVDLRVRLKDYAAKDSSNWHRCDGRWLGFHAPLRRGGS